MVVVGIGYWDVGMCESWVAAGVRWHEGPWETRESREKWKAATIATRWRDGAAVRWCVR